MFGEVASVGFEHDHARHRLRIHAGGRGLRRPRPANPRNSERPGLGQARSDPYAQREHVPPSRARHRRPGQKRPWHPCAMPDMRGPGLPKRRRPAPARPLRHIHLIEQGFLTDGRVTVTPGRGADHPTPGGSGPLYSALPEARPPRRAGRCKNPHARGSGAQSQTRRKELGQVTFLTLRGDRQRGGAMGRVDRSGTGRFTVGIHQGLHVAQRKPSQPQRKTHADHPGQGGGPRPGGADRVRTQWNGVGSRRHERTLGARQEVRARPKAIARQNESAPPGRSPLPTSAADTAMTYATTQPPRSGSHVPEASAPAPGGPPFRPVGGTLTRRCPGAA